MQTHYNFDTVHPRRHSNCVKWDKPGEDILPLWVADMDFTSPPEVIEALDKAVQNGIFGYPYYGKEVQETVAKWVLERHGWQIDPANVVLIPGVVTGFNLAANAVTQSGDGVLVQTPAYHHFLKVSKHFGLSQQTMQFTLGRSGQYQVDLDAFEAAITPQTRIFMLCNPQNPTGRVFTRQELEGMAEICLRHGVTICSDEIHSDLVYSGNTHIPIAGLDRSISDHTITLIAPSKTFNTAGLGASAAIIENEELRKRVQSARQGMVGHVNSLGILALQTAYQYGLPWLEALLVYLEENRDLVVRFVSERLPGIKIVAPQGTFLAWLDCRALGLESKPDEEFNPFFEKQAKVALNEGSSFGAGGKGFVRLNFGCPRATLIEALERMEAALMQVI